MHELYIEPIKHRNIGWDEWRALYQERHRALHIVVGTVIDYSRHTAITIQTSKEQSRMPPCVRTIVRTVFHVLPVIEHEAKLYFVHFQSRRCNKLYYFIILFRDILMHRPNVVIFCIDTLGVYMYVLGRARLLCVCARVCVAVLPQIRMVVVPGPGKTHDNVLALLLSLLWSQWRYDLWIPAITFLLLFASSAHLPALLHSSSSPSFGFMSSFPCCCCCCHACFSTLLDFSPCSELLPLLFSLVRSSE